MADQIWLEGSCCLKGRLNTGRNVVVSCIGCVTDFSKGELGCWVSCCRHHAPVNLDRIFRDFHHCSRQHFDLGFYVRSRQRCGPASNNRTTTTIVTKTVGAGLSVTLKDPHIFKLNTKSICDNLTNTSTVATTGISNTSKYRNKTARVDLHRRCIISSDQRSG